MNNENEDLKKQYAKWTAPKEDRSKIIGEISSEQKENLSIDDSEPIYAGKLIGKGGNSRAYEVEGKPEEVLLIIGSQWGGKGSQSREELQQNLEGVQRKIEMFKNVPDAVQAPKILKAWIKGSNVYEIMERAKGNVVHNRHGTLEEWQKELELLANAPDEHYSKLIDDIRLLHEAGFQFDPSKPDNFHYDPQTGFHIIDLEPGKYYGSLETPLIHTYNLYTAYGDKISPEIKKLILAILEKLNRAGDVPSIGEGVKGIKKKLENVV